MNHFPSNLISWTTQSKGRTVFVVMIWVGQHAIIVESLCTGRFEFFSIAREPMIYWMDLILSGLCLLAFDLIVIRHILLAKRKKAEKRSSCG